MVESHLSPAACGTGSEERWPSWPKAPLSKSGRAVMSSWVRIPPSPPSAPPAQVSGEGDKACAVESMALFFDDWQKRRGVRVRLKEHAWRACRVVRPSRVRIPASPPLFLEEYCLVALSGEVAVPCHPRSAPAGPNSSFEAVSARRWPTGPVLKAGSRAAGTCEPRQVRKEAAVSRLSRVPRDSLAGAVFRSVQSGPGRSRRSARPSLFYSAGTRG